MSHILRTSKEHRLGLTILTFYEPTLGDSNCFYRTVIQQIRRPDIQQQLIDAVLTRDHHTPRLAVVQFVRTGYMNQLSVWSTRTCHG